jgi:hypothetical protein
MDSPETPDRPGAIDRREALRRAALVLAGVLAGCEARRTPAAAWRPRVLSSDRAEMVATIAEHILPETDTPGARAVGVHRFIDALVAESYSAEERRHFLAGLDGLDDGARRAHGRAFAACTAADQLALLGQLDRAGDPFFRTLKQLTLVGYYTSEAGATRELHHVPVPGRYDGCVPLAQIGRTWAV